MVKKLFCYLLFFVCITGIIGCESISSRGSKNPYWGQVEGWARVVDDDEAGARQSAIYDARLKLAEKILGTQIMGIPIMENFHLVKNMMKAESLTFIKDEKIVNEGQRDGVFYVTLQGIVEQEKLEDAINKIINNK